MLVNDAKKPLIIYLDQNKWIELARIYYGRDIKDKNKAILEKVLSSIEKNLVIFPLSATHVIETQKGNDLDRRKRLASFIVEISLGNTIAPQSYISRYELDYVIAQKYGAKLPKTPSILGFGIPFAFGVTYAFKDLKTNNLSITTDEMNSLIKRTFTNKELLIQILVGNDKTTEKSIKSLQENRKKHLLAAEKLRREVRKYDKRLLKRAYEANLMLSMYNELSNVFVKYGQSFEEFLKNSAEQIESFLAKCRL